MSGVVWRLAQPDAHLEGLPFCRYVAAEVRVTVGLPEAPAMVTTAAAGVVTVYVPPAWLRETTTNLLGANTLVRSSSQ